MCFTEILELWNTILYESKNALKKEPILSNLYQESILKHKTFSSSLSYILSTKLSTSIIPEKNIKDILDRIYLKNFFMLHLAIKDLKAIFEKDPVVNNYLTPFLYFKGFHALESYRISHYLWNEKQHELSTYFQSRISTVFAVDIHPAACIGSGIMLDHATGIVIGEGVIIEDDVSILHSVTLGGTGKNNSKNRHPVIRKKVSIGAGAKVLGNIEIGSQTKIGAGSVVLQDIPPCVTVAGIPAKIVKKLTNSTAFLKEDQNNFLDYIEKIQYGDGI
ncbi:serine acetyltransferase [Buchnera aphidicola (Aphis glycines)]|uniref:Serine acetyltransferase n=1 Tax=Buchnera aphidicola (Aphis glycines) TaxID=1265350 RepID=A0A0M4HWH5_9GAMM|nr:serine O-acetyltransferase [Buchnera aphidicola]ALD15022.1 serine acetyltransferase [Buchnera aphidicola (Aphis glycines)]